MKFIVGEKIDMTQVWQGEKVVAVTRVKAGPCTVVQVKTEDNDGYQSVQIGYGVRKEKNIKKPQKGHMKGLGNFRYLREFELGSEDLKAGDVIEAATFAAGDKIQVTAISKGKGFQGVVRRHGFKGSKKTHGNKDQLRMSGSVGATGPAHVFKGTRMGGRMGGDRVTTKNLEIVEVNTADGIISIKGAVPGARNGLVMVSGEGELSVTVSAKSNAQDQPATAAPEKEAPEKEPAKDSGAKGTNTEKEAASNVENQTAEKSEK